jgi:hypothetical protein
MSSGRGRSSAPGRTSDLASIASGTYFSTPGATVRRSESGTMAHGRKPAARSAMRWAWLSSSTRPHTSVAPTARAVVPAGADATKPAVVVGERDRRDGLLVGVDGGYLAAMLSMASTTTSGSGARSRAELSAR